jgi:hypothetical protein
MKIEEIGKFLQEIQHLCIDARDGFSNKYGWQKGDRVGMGIGYSGDTIHNY